MIYFLGPYERFNYGDLLFPKILKYHFSAQGIDAGRIKMLGLLDADLRSHGGDVVEAFARYRKIFRPTDVLIVVGGESLGADSYTLYHYIRRSSFKTAVDKLQSKLPLMKKVERRLRVKKLYSYFTSRHLRLNTLHPYELSSGNTGCKVIYNAVGGRPAHPEVLAGAEYFSTRSLLTYNIIKSQSYYTDARYKLYPDCVVVMSKYLSREEMRTRVDKSNIDRMGKAGGRYIAVQINKQYCDTNRREILMQLEALYARTLMPILFVPIGIALGHEDVYACEALQKGLTAPSFVLNSETVYDIMYAISGAALFIGTSLHGNITAMSYDVPCMGLGNEKLSQYFQTWAGGAAKEGCVGAGSICDAAVRILEQPPGAATEANRKQKMLAEENMQNICKIVFGAAQG